MTNPQYGGTAFPAASPASDSLLLKGGVGSPAWSSDDGVLDDPSWYCTD